MRNVFLFFFSHRFLALARWDFHFLLLRLRNALTFQRRSLARFLTTRTAPVLLNLGSGPRGIDDEHWVNIDGFRDHNVQFLVDVQRRLPLPDESFDGVFCEHVLEHFTKEDGRRILRDVFRILRPGGSLRLIVPDGEFVLRTYLQEPQALVDYRGDDDATPMDTVNSFFRQRYEHHFIYDGQTMERLLGEVGFVRVRRSHYGEAGSLAVLTIDDKKYARESLYVEACKPGHAV